MAGAPAAAWTRFMFSFVWNTQALVRPSAHIPPAKLALLEQAVVAACDGRDGVPDGVLVAPDACHFDPRTLICKGGASDDCLSEQQAAAIAAIYDGPRTSDGRRLARGFPPGAETGPGGWMGWLTGPGPVKSVQAALAQGALAHMVFQRPEYDLRAFDFERDAAAVDARLGPLLNATDPDLSAFHERGGKPVPRVERSGALGVRDHRLLPGRPCAYGERSRRVRAPVPDPGPAALHRRSERDRQRRDQRAVGDAEHDLSAARERWVEAGIAPGSLVATAAPDRSNLAAPAPATPRRRICPYPQVASFRSTGSPDDPRAWTCEAH